MKKVTLEKIVIDHFRGRSLEVSFKGNTNIYGRNKIGKSTIYNAFLWVFTGCDMEGRSNFQLFDNKLELTYENSIPAKVDIYVDIDGNNYKFTRIAQQSWSRKRGESEYTKNQSDTYKFLIDDIELTSGEFKNRMEEMFAPTDCLKVILNFKHMFNLDWKEQRMLLSMICPEITKDDFKGEYGTLYKQLEKYSIEELESRIKINITPIKNELKSLPLTIDTLTANLPDITEAKDVTDKIANYKAQIGDIDNELQGQAKNIEPLIEKRNHELRAISDYERSIYEKKAKYIDTYNEGLNEIKKEIISIKEENSKLKREEESSKSEKESILRKIENSERIIKNLSDYRLHLKSKLAKVKEQTFTEGKCAYCGQYLPEEKLEELKTLFLENKNKEQEQIITEGRSNNTKIEAEKEALDELKKQLENYPNDFKNIVFKSDEGLQEKLKTYEEAFIPFENTEEFKEMNAKLQSMKENVTVIPESDNQGLLNMKKTLMQQIEDDSRLLGLVDERKKQENKIEEYKQRQRKIANELAEWEMIENQLKAYKQERAELVSAVVNRQLSRCKVEMMSQSKAGDWIPSCTITTDGVQSTVYNKAEKIFSGIDISNAFMSYYGLNMPLFIDDAESISNNNKVETERQTIKLIVSESDLIIKNE